MLSLEIVSSSLLKNGFYSYLHMLLLKNQNLQGHLDVSLTASPGYVNLNENSIPWFMLINL